jgi:hypothetical protein
VQRPRDKSLPVWHLKGDRSLLVGFGHGFGVLAGVNGASVIDWTIGSGPHKPCCGSQH